MLWTIQKWKWIYPNYPNWGKQTHFVVSYLRPYRILYPNYSDAGQLRYYLCLVVPFWFRIGWKVTVCNAYGPQPLTCHGLNHLLIIIIAAIIRKIRPSNKIIKQKRYSIQLCILFYFTFIAFSYFCLQIYLLGIKQQKGTVRDCDDYFKFWHSALNLGFSFCLSHPSG